MAKRGGNWRDYFLLNVSIVARVLIISDVIFLTGTGLLGPIFALFVVDFIQDGSAAVAGVAAAIYLLTKSLLQVPIASLMDRIKGERDDYWFLFLGSLASAILMLAYLIISTPLQLYIVQFLYGATMAMAFPSFMAIYTRHISRNKEGIAWGVYFTATDLSAALAATAGGILADTIGFRPLIVMASFLGLIGTLLIYFIRSHLRDKPKRRRVKHARAAA